MRFFPRPLLFQQLDAALHQPIVWIDGPPGAGKTTAVAAYAATRDRRCLWMQLDAGDRDLAGFFHYLDVALARVSQRHRRLPSLTAEYADVETFARNFARELCRRLPARTLVVLDNVQEVGNEPRFFDVLAAGLSELSPEHAAILISRSQPPPAFARLQVNGQLTRLDPDALRLTREELADFVGFLSEAGERLTAEEAQRRFASCEGWIAGVILQSEHSGSGANTAVAASGTQVMFDYFAAEVFSRRSPSDQAFLLQTALFPSFTAAMAERMTGTTRAAALLASLLRQHHFIERRTEGETANYQYHQLFRAFLLNRAETIWGAAERSWQRHRAAKILERARRPEEALALYLDCEHWSAAVRLILAQAGPFVAAGRFETLRSAIERLPADWCAQEPWLLYWWGLCRLPFDPGAGRELFERAFALFRARDDWRGVFLAWCGVLDGIVHTRSDVRRLDAWVALLDELGGHAIVFPAPEVGDQVASRMYAALILRRPDHPDFGYWQRRAHAVLEGRGDTNLRVLTGFYLFAYYTWTGHSHGAQYVLDRLTELAAPAERAPLAAVTAKMAQTWHTTTLGRPQETLARMEEGLALGSRTGVHWWDSLLLSIGALGALHLGLLDRSEALFARVAGALEHAGSMDRVYYFQGRAWQALAARDIGRARLFQEKAVAYAAESGILYLRALAHSVLSQVLHAAAEPAGAAGHLAEALHFARRLRSPLMEFLCLLTEVQYAFDAGNRAAAIERLRAAMAFGRQHELVHFAWGRPPLLARLCAAALAHRIEPDYVRRLIIERALPLPEEAADVDAWPFPVKIYALGRFTVLLEGDRPLRFAAKAQKRSLELLKALIALGGRQVAETSLCDALWPDADADRARQNLRATLHRLRKLIGSEAIVVEDGRLSLDPRRCWVDVWTFERRVNAALECDGREIEALAAAVDAALAFYRGPLLGGDDLHFALVARERLRGKLLRAIGRLTEALRAAGRAQQSIELAERGLEHEPLAEVFYQELMRAHLARGANAEALAVYERCRRQLQVALGIGPAAATEALRRQAMTAAPAGRRAG